MASLFDGTHGMKNVKDIYDKMEANYHGSPSQSKELWKLRHALNISLGQRAPKTMLDKAVAMLAKRGHMPGWFNRCPVAAGIVDPYNDNNCRVDLINWNEANKCARLVKLKWESDDLLSALMEIFRYGAAYLFCRVHKNQLPLNNRYVMDASHVSLEVVAPAQYFGHNLQDRIAQMSTSLNEFAGSKTGRTLSMSLNVLAFPDGFQIPFKNGADVRSKCDTASLTAEGKAVRDAFNNLTPVWPQS